MVDEVDKVCCLSYDPDAYKVSNSVFPYLSGRVICRRLAEEEVRGKQPMERRTTQLLRSPELLQSSATAACKSQKPFSGTDKPILLTDTLAMNLKKTKRP